MGTPPYSSEFKGSVIRRVQETPNVTLMARRHPLSSAMVGHWAWTAAVS